MHGRDATVDDDTPDGARTRKGMGHLGAILEGRTHLGTGSAPKHPRDQSVPPESAPLRGRAADRDALPASSLRGVGVDQFGKSVTQNETRSQAEVSQFRSGYWQPQAPLNRREELTQTMAGHSDSGIALNPSVHRGTSGSIV